MNERCQMILVAAGFLLMICLIASVTAAGLAHTWKERPAGEGSFSGVLFSTDGSTVYAGATRYWSVRGMERNAGGVCRELTLP